MNAVFHRRPTSHNQGQPPPPGAPPMEAEDMVMMSAEQQQQYYQEQQDMYMQQQQQQNPSLNPQQQQQAYYGDGYPAGDYSQNGSGMPNGAPANTTPSKKGIGFRPTGRAGAAILNSMKNLSLGTGVLNRGQGTSAGSPSKGAKSTTKDWETQWDEDEDSDDDDGDEQEKMPSAGPQHVNNKAHAPPMIRPGMEASGMTSPPPVSAANQKAHLVTATPEPGEDGVEWDTGAAGVPSAEYEKPNVQMFIPFLRVLGKGSFGKVVLVQKRVGKEKGQLFAMKILRKSHLVRRRQIERTRTERKVLSVVNHPFIMKLHYAFQTPDKLYLVLDYCPGGELFFHLSRYRRFPERVARFYGAELLLALGHLHKRGIIYRDLKPENVLLDAEGHVKLGDFGLAKAGIQHACEGATSMCGTPEYMAPEVLAQQGHGFCVDYWGLGMLIYEMMTGLPPWYTTDRTRLFRRLRSAPLDIPTYFSQSSANCVSALLERNPRRRLGVSGIRAAMEHEFFRSISWRALYGRRVEAPIRPCEGWNPPSEHEGDREQMQSDHPTLDAATANFDNTFTRMPVETDDQGAGDPSESEDSLLEELHEDTFVGFTFDDNDREERNNGMQQQQPAVTPQRQRTHHYGSMNGNGNGETTPMKTPTTGHQLD